MTEVFGLFGLFGATDGALQRLYYDVRGPQPGQTDVVFVALDDQTVAAWGNPPWDAQRQSDLVENIAAGDPRVIAWLAPGPHVVGGDDLAGLVDAHLLVVPADRSGLGQPKVVTGRKEVDSIYLRDSAGPTTTARALVRAGIDVPTGATSVVHFSGPAGRLPTVPANRVAAGEIPATTFSGRIVVIGARGSQLAQPLPTPVGPMSAAEIHANAALSLAHSASPAPLSKMWQRLLVAGLILLTLVAGSRLRHRNVLLMIAAIAVAVVVADYQLFSHNVMVLGASWPLVAVLLALVAAVELERRQVADEARAMARASGARLTAYAHEKHGSYTADELFERFSNMAASYVEFHSAAFGSMPSDNWRVRFSVFSGMKGQQLHERRRDVRRAPFKDAYVSLKPTFAERPFMDPELSLRTLVVPLVTHHRLLGVWVVNFGAEHQASDEDVEIIDGLARQLSVALERGRLARLGSSEALSDQVRPGHLLSELSHSRRLADSLAADRKQMSELLEWLPVGVLVSSIGGDIQFVNEQMRRVVGAFDVHDPRQFDLATLLDRIAPQDDGDIRSQLRAQLLDRAPIELSATARRDQPDAITYAIKLVPLSGADGEGALPTGFVVTTSPVSKPALAEIEWRWRQAEIRSAARVDVRTILRRTAEEVERGELSERPVVLEFPDKAPRAHIDGDTLEAAFGHVLRELGSSAAADPRWVKVSHDDEFVVIQVVDPTLTLAPGVANDRLRAASELLSEWSGKLEVDSDLDRGTTVVIRIPRESV